MPAIPFDCQLTLYGIPVRAKGKWWPARPGRTSGPPELCYEDQPADVSLASLKILDQDALLDLLLSFAETSQRTNLSPEEALDLLLISALEERQAELEAELEADESDAKEYLRDPY